ncbi:uncharacterized protein LOC144705853 [Wolffia australiana]
MGFFVSRAWPGLLLLLLLSCFLRGGDGAVQGYPVPSNCRFIECPTYKVVYSTPNFEIRRYPNDLWISSPPVSSKTYRFAADEAFNLLFAYINGRNDQGARVNMTAPAIVDITPSEVATKNSTFVVRFFVPKALKKEALPTAPFVTVGNWPRTKFVAVKRYGGFANDNNIPPQVQALTESLRGTRWAAALRDGKAVPSTYYVASYNGPFEFDRVNEVFFLF